MKALKLFCLCFIPVLSLSGLQAQDSNTNAVKHLFNVTLEELLNIEVVTAIKTTGNSHFALAVIEVITSEQLINRWYQNIGKVLNDIINNHEDRSKWGIGGLIYQNVGFGFCFDYDQKVPLLFNSQRLNTFLPGERFDEKEAYFPYNIDRIEIIRDSDPALYGKGAFMHIPFTMFNIDDTIPIKWLRFNISSKYRCLFVRPDADPTKSVKIFFVARYIWLTNPKNRTFQFNLIFRNLFNKTYCYSSLFNDFINHFPKKVK
jgi:hypothetical protein